MLIITNYKAGITKRHYSLVNKIRSAAYNIQQYSTQHTAHYIQQYSTLHTAVQHTTYSSTAHSIQQYSTQHTAHNIQTLKEMEIMEDSPQNYKETFLTNNNTQ